MFTSSTKAESAGIPVPVPSTPPERAAHAGTVSAEAAKCGYNFDPLKLRAAYISYETAQGQSPEEVAKLTAIYDSTRGKLVSAIGKADEFCTEAQTEKTKKELTKELAGDFAGPMKPPPPPSSFWGTPATNNNWDKEKALYPKGRV